MRTGDNADGKASHGSGDDPHQGQREGAFQQSALPTIVSTTRHIELSSLTECRYLRRKLAYSLCTLASIVGFRLRKRCSQPVLYRVFGTPS
jgi:hypothetical protein